MPDLNPGSDILPDPSAVTNSGATSPPIPPIPSGKPPKLSSHSWFVANKGQRTGPWTTEQLRAGAKDGKVLPDTLIWREGLAKWVAARQVQGLFDATLLQAQAISNGEPPPIPLPDGFEYASPVKRAFAFVIDFFVCLPFGIVLAGLLGEVGVLFYQVGAIAYFAAMESSPKSATIGKLALGLRVGKPDGTRLSLENALGRSLAKILSALPLGLGFAWAFFDEQGRCWHDLLAGTVVVCKSSPTGSQVPKAF